MKTRQKANNINILEEKNILKNELFEIQKINLFHMNKTTSLYSMRI